MMRWGLDAVLGFGSGFQVEPNLCWVWRHRTQSEVASRKNQQNQNGAQNKRWDGARESMGETPAHPDNFIQTRETLN